MHTLMHRRGTWLLIILVAIIVGLIWFISRDESPPRSDTTAAIVPAPRRPASNSAPASSTAAPADPNHSPHPSAAPPREKRAHRDTLRKQILNALEARRPSPSGDGSSSTRRTAEDDEDTPPAEGNLTDRIGGRDALLKVLNGDFMPLADECIQQAQQRDPQLRGMLVISLETIADEELGAVVESVEAASDNEVDQPALLECIQQTALSMTLPPPPTSGRDDFTISLRIEAPTDAG